MAAAASSKQLLRQLKDKDPVKRKAAIKALARAKDRNALKQLAWMSGDDRDPEVRELALKAGQYILHETGGLQQESSGPPPVKLDKKGRPVRVAVSPEDKKQAEELLNVAMNAHQQGDVGKAMRSLAKALNTDPNLRTDSYFASLAESATGLEGAEAVDKLYSRDAQTEAEQVHTEARRREHDAAHQEKISAFGWKDVGLDATLLVVISVLAFIVVGFLAMQSAQGYIDNVYNNWDAVQEAQLAGRYVADPEDDAYGMYYEEELDDMDNPVYFSAIEPDVQFWNTANNVSEANAGAILGGGVGVGVAFGIMCVLMTAIIHIISSLTGGKGSITYTGHAVLGLMVNRAVVLAIVAGAGTFLIFSSGGGDMITIVMVIVGLILAQMLLKLLARLIDAYDYAMPQAVMATAAGMLAFVPFVIVLLSVL